MRLLVLALLAGCTKAADTGPTLDTGWFTADTGCDDTAVETWPKVDQDDWYWRSPPAVQTSSDAVDAYDARLVDGQGVAVETALTWNGNSFKLDLPSPLQPDSAYLFEVADCEGATSIPFRTSSYGLPLDAGPGQLVGTTFLFDMSIARWDEPPGMGSLLALYFNTPILVGVEWADAGYLDLIGGQGGYNDDGDVIQVFGEPTWDFPAVEFVDAPYFEAVAPTIVVSFDGVEVPIHDFAISGTFAADGSSLGGARASGLGDTRNMGELLNRPGVQSAVCEVAESTAGVTCEACPDGEPYCLQISARDALGVMVPGLTMRRIDAR